MPLIYRKRIFFISAILSCIILIAESAKCQPENPLYGFGSEINLFSGKVIKHTVKFHLPVPEVSTGADINFQWKTYGKKEWEQRRRYPIVGIGVTYTNYGIDSIYGRCFSIYPNITIPLICGKKIEWTLRIGDGAGYVTRDYSRMSPVDTINNAIGSHLNDYASFMTDIRYHFNNHWDIQAGLNFSHISDASYHQPNLGVNLAGAHIGIKYFPVTSEPKHIVRDLKPLKNRWLVQGRITMGYNESQAPLGPLYPIYIGTGYVSRRWLSKNKMFGGIDCSYHPSIYAYLRNNPSLAQSGTESQLSYKSALFAGNEFLLGRVGVVLQAGYYIKQAYQVQGKYYEKIGGNLYLVKKEKGPIKEFFICAFLKTHLSVAEFTECGLGVGF